MQREKPWNIALHIVQDKSKHTYADKHLPMNKQIQIKNVKLFCLHTGIFYKLKKMERGLTPTKHQTRHK